MLGGKAVFVYTTCLIVSCASVNGQVTIPIMAMVTGTSSIWQMSNIELKLTDMLINKSRTTIDDLGVSLIKNLELISKNLENVENSDKSILDLRLRVYELGRLVSKINERYIEFSFVANPRESFNLKSKKDFALGVVNKTNGIESTHVILFNNIVGDGKKSLVHLLNSIYEDFFPFCRTLKTKQRFFYDFFLSILAHEYRTYTLMRYSYEFNKTRVDDPDYYENVFTLNTNTNNRVVKTIEMFKPILSRSSRLMRRCDLKTNHVEGETYTYLKNLFTRIFQYGMEIKKYISTCSSECPGKASNILGIDCNGECQIKQRMCRNLVYCEHASEHDLCLENDQNETRRYLYVKDRYSSWRKFMNYLHLKQTSCEQEYFIADTMQCSMSNVCDCVCDESDHTDRYFSLDNVTAKVDFNYVVTGLKIIKNDSIVRLQIQEGELAPFGLIKQETVKWVAIAEHDELYYRYTLVDTNEINDNDNLKKNSKTMSNEDMAFVGLKKPYHNVTWAKNRGIFLNNVKAAEEHVVTGIKFSVDHSEEENFLKIEIQQTKFDFVTGKLITGTSFWNSSDVKDFINTSTKSYVVDAPTNINLLHESNWIENQIVYFKPTSLISKDTGSTVVPYLDIQPVHSTVAVPLSGVGLNFLSAPNSGGYLILKSESLQILPYIY